MTQTDIFHSINLSWEHYFIKTHGGLGVKYQYKDRTVVDLPSDLPQPPSDYPVIFSGCHHLVNIDALAKWDASTMTNTTGMFNHCRSLKDISPLRNWDLSNVTDMSHMFNCCYVLNDVSAILSWDISKVKRAKYIFNGCYELPDFARLEVYDQQTFNCFVERYLIEPTTYIQSNDYNIDDLYYDMYIEEEEEEYKERDEVVMGPCLSPANDDNLTVTGVKYPSDEEMLSDSPELDDLSMTLAPGMIHPYLQDVSDDESY